VLSSLEFIPINQTLRVPVNIFVGDLNRDVYSNLCPKPMVIGPLRKHSAWDNLKLVGFASQKEFVRSFDLAKSSFNFLLERFVQLAFRSDGIGLNTDIEGGSSPPVCEIKDESIGELESKCFARDVDIRYSQICPLTYVERPFGQLQSACRRAILFAHSLPLLLVDKNLDAHRVQDEQAQHARNKELKRWWAVASFETEQTHPSQDPNDEEVRNRHEQDVLRIRHIILLTAVVFALSVIAHLLFPVFFEHILNRYWGGNNEGYATIEVLICLAFACFLFVGTGLVLGSTKVGFNHSQDNSSFVVIGIDVGIDSFFGIIPNVPIFKNNLHEIKKVGSRAPNIVISVWRRYVSQRYKFGWFVTRQKEITIKTAHAGRPFGDLMRVAIVRYGGIYLARWCEGRGAPAIYNFKSEHRISIGKEPDRTIEVRSIVIGSNISDSEICALSPIKGTLIKLQNLVGMFQRIFGNVHLVFHGGDHLRVLFKQGLGLVRSFPHGMPLLFGDVVLVEGDKAYKKSEERAYQKLDNRFTGERSGHDQGEGQKAECCRLSPYWQTFPPVLHIYGGLVLLLYLWIVALLDTPRWLNDERRVQLAVFGSGILYLVSVGAHIYFYCNTEIT
jgi:hypothetical protein